MIAEPLPGPYRLTYRDWLDLPHDKGRLYEVIDGELNVSATPAVSHQRVVKKLFSRLEAFVEGGGLGEVFTAPLGVRLDDDNVPEPDVLMVLKEHAARIGTHAILGPPDLVIEVLSPGTARRDLRVKRELYARFGIPEYWIADAIAPSVEVLALEQGAYARAGLYRPGERLTSLLLPGFSLEVASIVAAPT